MYPQILQYVFTWYIIVSNVFELSHSFPSSLAVIKYIYTYKNLSPWVATIMRILQRMLLRKEAVNSLQMLYERLMIAPCHSKMVELTTSLFNHCCIPDHGAVRCIEICKVVI